LIIIFIQDQELSYLDLILTFKSIDDENI